LAVILFLYKKTC